MSCYSVLTGKGGVKLKDKDSQDVKINAGRSTGDRCSLSTAASISLTLASHLPDSQAQLRTAS